MNWNHKWKQLSFFARHKKEISEEFLRPQRNWFRIFQLNIRCRVRKTIFEKNLTLASPCWKESIFSEKDVLPMNGIVKDSLHIKTHFSGGCNCLGERNNYLLLNISSSHQAKKDSFLKMSFRFLFFSEKDRCLKSCAFERSVKKKRFYCWAAEKSKNCFSHHFFANNRLI